MWIRVDVKLTDRAVLIAIIKRNGQSQHKIAEAIGCDRTTVIRAIKRLTALGYITRVGSGRRVASHYIIHTDRLPEGING